MCEEVGDWQAASRGGIRTLEKRAATGDRGLCCERV